jgi:hypothetical protein
MEKEFVTYELALRMKQLGFDEPCVAHWFNNVGIGIEFRLEPLNEAIAKTNISVYYELAPLYQQAFRWFREKYGLNQSVYGKKSMGYDFKINGISNEDNRKYEHQSDLVFKNYEEAELACLEKLCEIVEQRK